MEVQGCVAVAVSMVGAAYVLDNPMLFFEKEVKKVLVR
jgi:hypothetical protein